MWLNRTTIALCVSVIGLLGLAQYRYTVGKVQSEHEWQNFGPSAIELGLTSELSILPLVDWHTVSGNLKGEFGVSYLIKTDTDSILLDLGNNDMKLSPSSLEHNMRELGVTIDEVDTIVISHNHFDHVGGMQWSKKGTFSLGNTQIPLDNQSIYSASPMNYPGSQVTELTQPTKIGAAVGTTGAIGAQLYGLGRVNEQALVVNVEGKGLVVIVACAHQTVAKVIARVKAVYSEPIYGIVGGLHYPLHSARSFSPLGINLQRLLSSGDGLFDPLGQDDVHRDIDMLKTLGLGLVSIGGHDSSDGVIELFEKEFKHEYRSLSVGSEIKVIGANPVANSL